jgi:hypothetical protein
MLGALLMEISNELNNSNSNADDTNNSTPGEEATEGEVLPDADELPDELPEIDNEASQTSRATSLTPETNIQPTKVSSSLPEEQANPSTSSKANNNKREKDPAAKVNDQKKRLVLIDYH